MKVFWSAAFFLVLLCFVSCSRKVVSRLPDNVGENCLAEKTFTTEQRILKFISSKELEKKSLLPEDEDFENDCVANYSINSQKKQLWIQPTGIWMEGKLIQSSEDFVNEAMASYDDEIDGMLCDGYLEIDDASRKIYKAIVKKSCEAQGKLLLDVVEGYEYDLSTDGAILNLSQLPATSACAVNLEGNDSGNNYSANLFGTEIVFLKQEDDIGNQIVYYAFGDWNKDVSVFKGFLYSVVVKVLEEGENLKRTIYCRSEGNINGKLNFSVDKSEGFFFYSATMTFSKLPECIKDLKDVSFSGVEKSSIESYSLY